MKVGIYDNEPSAAPSLAPTTLQPTFSSIENPIPLLTSAPIDASPSDTGGNNDGGGGCCARIREAFKTLRDQALSLWQAGRGGL